MAIKKLALISGSIAAVGLTSIIGVGAVSAQGQTASDSGIVDKIAQKFNLKKDDVQKVFTDDRAAHDAQRQADMKTKLDQAVKDGKITAAQETALIAKLDEMQKNRPDIASMTQAERDAARTAMEKNRTDFQAWLTTNNIPSNLVPQQGRGMGHGGPGMRSDTTTQTTTTTN